jgi:pimeloyl-ACP methyl ester carboxylesterase
LIAALGRAILGLVIDLRVPRALALSATCLSLLSSCDGAVAPSDAGVDAGTPPTCADPATRWAFPSPRWEASGGLVVPDQDRAGDAVRAMGWEAELTAVAGWPRRPTWVVPLDRVATQADATKVRLAVREGDGWREVDAPFSVAVLEGEHLAVQPRDPFPAGAREVLIALEPGVAGEARALGVCDGAAAHEQAAAEWPGSQALELAMRLSIADATLPLARVRERVAASPALIVRAHEAVELASLGDAAPPPAAAPHFAPRIVRGQLDLPEYRAEGAPWTLDAEGAPIAQGTTSPAFVVALPSAGAAPYPTVLYQHGGGGSPIEVLQVGGALAEAGFAFVAIDLPEHGLRAPSSGGGELSFLDFESMQRTRENFRQTVADHLAVLGGFDALNEAIEAELAVAGALDPARTFYMGLSLGGVSGAMTTAVAHDLVASALFVGGGGYPELLRYGLFSVLATRILRGEEPRPTVMLAIVETIGDAGDPLAYAQEAEDRSATPTPILFLQAVDDALVSAASNDQLARAFGASLARPFDHEVEGLTPVDLPASDTFAWSEGEEAATRILVHAPMNEVPSGRRHGALIALDYAQAMVAHCFSGARDGEACEVIDTGFADR